MPTLSQYDPARPELLDDLAKAEFAARRDAIGQRWGYYRGEFAKPLKVRAGQADDNVIINMVRKVVNQSVYLLFGVVPRFELPAPDGSKDEDGKPKQHPAEPALERIWEDNGLELLLHNLGVEGALAGHNYVKLMQTPDLADGVRIVRLDPSLVSVFWRPDDREKVLAYRIQWTEGDVTYRQDVVDMGGSWQINEWEQRRGQKWVQTNSESWPYPFAPIVDWQNLPDPQGYYGLSDLVNPSLNDSTNRVASNTNRIIKFHAHPKTIGVGMRPDDVKETAVDGFWAVPNPQANIFNLEMSSDLASSMSYAEFLQAAFYSEHDAVDLASIKDRLGQLTNFGLQLLFWDATNKLRAKRLLYGKGLALVAQRALIVAGYADAPEPTINWADALPMNRTEQVEAVGKEVDLGLVSRETAAGDLGRDWEVESERLDEEAAEQQERMPATGLLEQYEKRPGQPGLLQKKFGR